MLVVNACCISLFSLHVPLNLLVRLCLTCGELDSFLFKKKKNRQKCKGHKPFSFFCSGIFAFSSGLDGMLSV